MALKHICNGRSKGIRGSYFKCFQTVLLDVNMRRPCIVSCMVILRWYLKRIPTSILVWEGICIVLLSRNDVTRDIGAQCCLRGDLINEHTSCLYYPERIHWVKATNIVPVCNPSPGRISTAATESLKWREAYCRNRKVVFIYRHAECRPCPLHSRSPPPAFPPWYHKPISFS